MGKNRNLDPCRALRVTVSFVSLSGSRISWEENLREGLSTSGWPAGISTEDCYNILTEVRRPSYYGWHHRLGCGCGVSHYLKFLPSWLSCYDDLQAKIVSQSKPCLPFADFLPGYFIIAAEMKLGQLIFLSTGIGKAVTTRHKKAIISTPWMECSGWRGQANHQVKDVGAQIKDGFWQASSP